MASIRLDPRNGRVWQVYFTYRGHKRFFSCETEDETEARAIEARISETERLLKRGRLTIPDGADAGLWIFSDGKTGMPLPVQVKAPSLDEACKSYLDDQKDKAETTVSGERIHLGHLKRVLGVKTKVDAITLETLQVYVNTRMTESNRSGGKVGSGTIKKELVTFSQVWTWARQRKFVVGDVPFRDPYTRKWAIKLPKPKDTRQFVTLDEGAGDGHYVYLNADEVKELLAYVKERGMYPHVHPMFALVAYTGIRRSELLQARVRDVKFDRGEFIVREKKRKKSKQETTRRVPMKDTLVQILREWLNVHPNPTPDAPLITLDGEPMTRDAAHNYLKNTLKGSRWDVLKGFHTLRHSFAAVCVRAGIPSNVVGELMGHTTLEMMKLYQHIFPQDMHAWMKDNFPTF